MTEAKEEQIPDLQQSPPQSKRKPDLDYLADEDVVDMKKFKPNIHGNPPLKEALGGDKEDFQENEEEDKEEEEDDIDSNGHAAANKGKALVRTLDKGKGKMVIAEEEEEEEEEGKEDDDGSEESGDVIEAGEDDESDFEDDPLAEVDLSNILPSRTRRKAPPQPGAYLVNEQEGDDDDDDDDDVCH